LPIVVILLGLVAIFIFGGGVGRAHEGQTETSRGPIDGDHDLGGLDALTRQLLDQRLGADERLRIAAARRERLAALMERDPGEVLKRALAPAMRAALAPGLQALVEQEESQDGTLQVLHTDGPKGGAYLYNLREGSGEWLTLHFAQGRPDVPTGARVRVRGVRVQQALALGGSGAVTVLAAPTLSGAFGEHRTLVILVKFQNATTVALQTPAGVQPIMFGTGGSVSDFYREGSYQQAWLTGDVTGPFVIPTTTVGCDYNLIATLSQSAATAAGLALGDYRHFVYAFSGSDCPWWGLGTVGGIPGQAWINGPIQTQVVAHELGHTFGLYHSHSWECGSATFGGSCSSIEYGDFFDTMGSVSPSHFNAVQKELLGWLAYDVSPPITTVQASGTYTLDPFETPGSNPKALKVQTALGDWFYVEYRRPTGFDTTGVSGNANVTNGVLIHYWNGQRDGIYLLDMTPATASWVDPALDVGNTFSDTAGGVSITPVWVNGTTAGVNVTVVSAACVRTNPTVTLTPAQQQGAAGTPLTYTVSVGSNDTGCGTSSIALQATAPSGWSATFGAASLTLGDGATGSTTLSVNPPIATLAGTYTLTIMASDQGFSTSASASYVVMAPSGATGTFTDSFDRPDSPALGNGWSAVSGSLKIVSGEARNDTARAMHTAVQTGFVGATQTVAAKFASMDNNLGPQFGVVLRYQDAANYYRCYRSAGGSSTVRIAKVVGGVETVLKWMNIGNPMKGVFFTLSCQVSGTTLTLQINGTTWISVSNSIFASGSVGLQMGYVAAAGAGVSHRADNFSATVK